MKKVLIEDKERIHVNAQIENLGVIDNVIEKYPNFPFGYYAKCIILQNAKNPEWKAFAKKAEAIFEITTTIKGHHESHDAALKVLRHQLATN